ncbi:hypothetical protein Q0N71_23250 [Bacillus thuringiensis]|uniref:S-Ena type endospore appendage n=1 Tax=Bacillus thuringiensis TaxID=1428 RepID=UPI0034598A35
MSNNIIFSPANERCCRKSTYIPIERCQYFSLSNAASLDLISVDFLSSNLMGFPVSITVFNDESSTMNLTITENNLGLSAISPGSSLTLTDYQFLNLATLPVPVGEIITGKICFTLYYRIRI